VKQEPADEYDNEILNVSTEVRFVEICFLFFYRLHSLLSLPTNPVL